MYKQDETAARIKAERKKRGWTQRELAERVSTYSEKTLRDWEKGNTPISVEGLLELSAVFECDVNYLLGIYEHRTKETTDICKETGLSEDAVEKLHREALILQNINKYNMEFNSPPLKHTTITGFVSYFLVNSQSIFDTIGDFELHERYMAYLRTLPFFQLIQEAFFEAQKEPYYSIFDKEAETFITQNNQEHFYYLLEAMLDNYFQITKPSRELKELIERGAVMAIGGDLEEIFEKSDKSNPVEEIISMLLLVFDTYHLLEMEQKKKYFKYEISDVFIDIVKAYVKEGAEDGRKDKL